MTEPTPIRTDSIYVSYVARAGLRYVSEAMEIEGRSDALADQIIMDWLKANHATVLDHIKARFDEDRKFKDKLMGKINNVPFNKPL